MSTIKSTKPLALAFTLALTILAFAAAIAQAETAAPGWEITSSTFPTNLAPGSAVDEVQEVTVAASEGTPTPTFTLFFREHETVAIPFNASPATVQADLQALLSIGAGNVTVTGGPGDPTGTKPYVLTFIGTLGGVDTGEILTNGEHLGGGTVTDTVTTEGAPGGALELNVYNVGAAPSTGQVTVTDTLPPGILATAAGDLQRGDPEGFGQSGLWDCTGNGSGPPPGVEGASVVICTNDPLRLPSLPVVDAPTPPITLDAFEAGGGEILHLGVGVTVQPGAVTGENRVTVSGGGASAAAATHAPVTVSSSPAPAFGFQNIDGWASRVNGTIDTQAGSHPYELDFTFDLNTERNNARNLVAAGGQPRDLAVKLPPGLVGNPTAVPQCTRTDFDNERCNPATQVGVDVPLAPITGKIVPFRIVFPVYNLVPPPGEPAQFGSVIVTQQLFLDARVRSGGNYGITVHAKSLPQGQVNIRGNRIVLWGEPSDPSHDGFRFSTNWENAICGALNDPGNGCASSAPRIPFLTLASACAGPQETTASVNAWETTGFGEMGFSSHDANFSPVGITGCEHLTFAPSVSVAPDTSSADTPAGLTVDVRVPQEGLVTPGALATSDIKNTTVVLPPGVVINPGQAAGLQACQQGPTEPQPSGELLHPGRDNLPLPGENGEEERFDGPADCPNASKVGTVKIVSPLLKEALEGNVYVLQSNPPHLKLLFTASGEGVNLKLVAETSLCEQAGEEIDGKTCEAAGQLITKITESPQLPFTNFELAFSGGAQAALDTPTHCGSYTTTSDFEPWSAPAVAHAFPSSSFQITSGTGGGACPSGTLPFAPSLIAGATNPKGGASTGFSMLLQSGDGQQRIEKLQFKLPQGLSGMLSAVPLCPEPQAAQGTCSAASQIGHSTVASGPGPYPLSIPQPGDPESPIYLTGPYQGAPFGLTIVTHVIAGPFNLGNVITRAKIEVDLHTAQVTVTTDPLPQVIDGVPTDLRLVDAVIDRPGFMFNPTHCAPAAFAGTAWGTPPPGAGGPGATAAIASSFDVVGCKGLGFAPKFAVATSGKTSRSKGASLDAKVIYPAVPQGTEANIASVKVDLPKQLPSRLTTLQKACTAAQFESNPAGCPSASVIGHATAITQVLPVPLTGPAIFVSHGGEAFPSLIIVLQGYGVRVDLVATTFISHAGITSSTFKTLPDVPFKTFDLNLPEGKYSALAANGNLCTSKLKMPTAFVGQNGAVIHESTPISVTGCAKVKALTRGQKLTRALKACHKKAKGKRAACVKTAHKRYVVNTNAKGKKHAGGKRHG
jgi:hypothetical protein